VIKATRNNTNNSMEQSPSWDTNTYPASKEIHHIIWNLNTHFSVHKSLQRDSNEFSLYPFIYFSEKSCISDTLSIAWSFQRTYLRPLSCMFPNMLVFYSKELLALCPNPKHQDQPQAALYYRIFSTFVAAICISKLLPLPASGTWRCAMSWWQGTHLTWKNL
jgi:hypothetical protein